MSRSGVSSGRSRNRRLGQTQTSGANKFGKPMNDERELVESEVWFLKWLSPPWIPVCDRSFCRCVCRSLSEMVRPVDGPELESGSC